MRFSLLLLILASALLTGTGCGLKSDAPQSEFPATGSKAADKDAALTLGFPSFATKNTTRIGSADAAAAAAAVSLAVYPSTTPDTRPQAITLVDGNDWRQIVAAAVLMSPTIRAPMLLTNKDVLPSATQAAIRELQPTGTADTGKTQFIRVGDQTANPSGYKSTVINGSDSIELAAAIDRFQSSANKRASANVVVVSADQADFSVPAAAWAAKSGDSVLFVHKTSIPAATANAIRTRRRPNIYILGPESIIAPSVATELRKLGRVVRISGTEPIRNSIAFARYSDSNFGWGVTNPGHGIVFGKVGFPEQAAVAAPLSASGSYGPLLLLGGPTLATPINNYLLDIQPGFSEDPARGVYNHGWLIGDDDEISLADQARIDKLLEITEVKRRLIP